MISQILVAVDDSPGGLAAAKLAVDLACGLGARLTVLAVHADGQIEQTLAARHSAGCPASAVPVLGHVAGLAGRAGVTVVQTQLEGEVAGCVLDQAKASAADLIVIGRSRQSGYGQPYIGSQTRMVLEFSTAPVVAVPPP